MRKTIPLILILGFFGIQIQAQVHDTPYAHEPKEFLNSIYAEFGGAGIFLSINYDLIINESSVIRIGATPNIFSDPGSENLATFDEEDFKIAGIISYSLLVGKRSNKLESGIGIIFGDEIKYDGESIPPALFLNLGYRFVTRKVKGASFKASFTPFINDKKFKPWMGISIGYSFK